MDMELFNMELQQLQLFFGLLIGMIVAFVFRHLLYLRQLHPGPWGLPVVGSMLHLNKANVFIEFERYRQKYGPVFSMTVGSFNVVVINGHKLIREAFKQEVFNARPDFDAWRIRNLGMKNRGILFSDGNHSWNEQRRFTLKQLRDFGFGKDSMEGMLLNELEHLISHLRKYIDQSVDMKNIFNASVLNSLWLLISGRRFELEDESFQSIIALLTANLKHTNVCGPQVFFSWPVRYGLVRMTEVRKRFMEQRDRIIGLLESDIKKHEESYQQNVERDFIDVYLKQIKSASEPGSSFHGEEGRKNLLIVLQDLFVAGAETTSTTLLWAILHLVTNQRVQCKLFHEIESKIGSRQPGREDRTRLIYVEAFLNEVHRHASLVPFSIYHRVFEDTKYEGHFIPKGTVVLGNLYEAHHNKEYWGDPYNFRPERFLNSDETELIKHDALMAFSTGKRVCLGEALARDTLFLFLTGLVQKFSFKLDPSNEGCYDPSAIPPKAILILSPPKDFKVVINNR